MNAGVFPELLTMGRREAEAFDVQPGDVCISITGDADYPAKLPVFDAVIRLSFADDSFDGWERRNLVITPYDAARVIEFVEQHLTARRLIIHCEVGASRSVSMAFALAQCYGSKWAGPTWWERMRPDGSVPNRGVFHRIVQAYRRRRATAETVQ